MSTSKKVIKLFAEILAVLLIALFVYGLSTLIYGLSFVFGNDNKYKDNIMLIQDNIINNIDNYSFTVKTEKTNVIIIKSETFNVETNNKNISIDYDKDSNTIMITERKLPLFNYLESYDMKIYLPSTLFKEVNITTNAGNVEADSLVSNKFYLSVGAGKTKIDSLTAYKETALITGVGKVNIRGKLLNNLTLNNGIGETKIKANITGKSKIESGVGNINLDLLQSKNHYSFELKKGVGDIHISGELMKDGKYGEGPSYIYAETNIGKININFEE